MSESSAAPPFEPGSRTALGAAWAAEVLQRGPVELATVSGDASFRRYFRFHHLDRSLILMDAPPDREDSVPFLDIAKRLREAGLHAPEVIAFDLDQGFGLLEDFGDTLYRSLIDESSVDRVFPPLFDVLERMATQVEPTGLPPYDPAFLQQELDLFRDWYLARHKGKTLSAAETGAWKDLCERLIESAIRQPQVFVHRDFHSCNLLETEKGPGIIDFQDAMHGPLNYDFISLVWDRYLPWPRARIEAWMRSLHGRLARQMDLSEMDSDDWIRSCDWMGLQRNLKVVGIFARLWYRDGKHGYLEMIPAFYGYLRDVLPRYPEFHHFHQLLEQDECAP